MERPINATLTFNSENINFRRRMKYLELELLQLSELKIKLDDKLAIENFKKINDRTLSDDIPENTSIELDLNKIINLIFHSQKQEDFLTLVQFKPISFLENEIGSGSLSNLYKCRNNLNNSEYAFE